MNLVFTFERYMRCKMLLVLFMFVFSQILLAQKISFEKSVINVGGTLWRRPITAVFTFTNKNHGVLIVEDVDPGCGCLDVKWTKNVLNKGEQGFISITYDAQLLGHFDKVVNVYTNVDDKPQRIRMKGVVLHSVNEEAKNIFPYQIGDIMLSSNDIEFPDVHKGDSATVSFEILNNTDEVYTPQLMHLPSYITAEYTPTMLGRGRRGVVSLKLDTDKMTNIGVNQTNIYLARYSGDKVSDENDISVTSVLLPESLVSADDLLKPNLRLSSNVICMGKLGRKSKLTGKVILKNEGAGVLNIEHISVYNQALTVSMPTRLLQPGESMKMKVTLQAKYLDLYNTQPRVLIITNDPDKQKETIVVKFEK